MRYTPFLKLKTNEIQALKSLDDISKQQVIPFFDFPNERLKNPISEKDISRSDQEVRKIKNELFSKKLTASIKNFNKNLGWLKEFYLDNYDIEDYVSYKGKYNYQALIDGFGMLNMIPVVGLDRDKEHLRVLLESKIENKIRSNKVAVRLVRDDFEDFNYSYSDLKVLFNNLSYQFSELHLVIDCRVIELGFASQLKSEVVNFLLAYEKSDIKFHNIIVTGSTIPATISDLVDTNTTVVIDRLEMNNFSYVISKFSNLDICFGDYTCVSPDYSDVDIYDEALQGIMTAKVIYPFNNKKVIARGGSIKQNSAQYPNLIKSIIAMPGVYRGAHFSWGDSFLFQKKDGVNKLSKGINSTAVTPGSIVKPSVNLHISFMLKYVSLAS